MEADNSLNLFREHKVTEWVDVEIINKGTLSSPRSSFKFTRGSRCELRPGVVVEAIGKHENDLLMEVIKSEGLGIMCPKGTWFFIKEKIFSEWIKKDEYLDEKIIKAYKLEGAGDGR